MNAAVEYMDAKQGIPMNDLDAPLFHSAQQAVRFAVNKAGVPSRPMMSRMGDKSIEESGLGGLDGAAQAGIIMSVLHRLGKISEASLVAASAPHSLPCACRRPCCSGRAFNRAWNEAINTLCDGIVIIKLRGSLFVAERGAAAIRALRADDASQVEIDHGIKLGALLKIYGTNLTLVKIATQTGKDADTVSKYHRAIQHWLKGAPAGRHSESIEGVETIAWRDAESALRDRGIVGG